MPSEERKFKLGSADVGHGVCPICGEQIRTDHLMCVLHWTHTPARHQRLVLDAFSRWERGKITLGALREIQVNAAQSVFNLVYPSGQPVIHGHRQVALPIQ